MLSMPLPQGLDEYTIGERFVRAARKWMELWKSARKGHFPEMSLGCTSWVCEVSDQNCVRGMMCLSTRARQRFPSAPDRPLRHLSAFESTSYRRPTGIVVHAGDFRAVPRSRLQYVRLFMKSSLRLVPVALAIERAIVVTHRR